MTVPYNILSASKKWRNPYKSRVCATLLFFNCRKRDYKANVSIRQMLITIDLKPRFPLKYLVQKQLSIRRNFLMAFDGIVVAGLRQLLPLFN